MLKIPSTRRLRYRLKQELKITNSMSEIPSRLKQELNIMKRLRKFIRLY